MIKREYVAAFALVFFLSGCVGLTRNQAVTVGALTCGVGGAGFPRGAGPCPAGPRLAGPSGGGGPGRAVTGPAGRCVGSERIPWCPVSGVAHRGVFTGRRS
jgi:hypothetical protein